MKISPILLSVFMLTNIVVAHAETNGAEILTTKCSACHATPEPSQYSTEEWKERIETMAVYAKLNEEEKQAVIKIKE